jgi:predicted chitinase
MVSIESGYTNIINYYDELNKDLLVFNIDSITSKGTKTIILKGSPQDEEFFKLNKNVHYLGVSDTDNCHKNYMYSQIQNEKNIFDLEKMGLEVVMRTPNFGVYKYQKIKVFLSNQTSTPSATLKNERLSGDWLIIDIKYTYSEGSFNQTLRLIKRELELSNEELSNEVQDSPKSDANKGIDSNSETENNVNTPLTPISSTASIANNLGKNDVSLILTREIFRRIYAGKVNQKVIETMYEPIVSALVKYGMDTNVRICAFLSQINAESGFLKFVTELSSGAQYDNREDLGNGPNDGAKYKGRGLLQITGKHNYKKSGEFLNKDFVNFPETVSADNKTHINASDSAEQLSNSALVSVRYWLKGSSWGNLNSYADDMDINKSIDTGIYSIAGIPNTQSEANNAGFKTKAKNNFATDSNSSNNNLLNLTLISFGINGGYNGYRDRIKNWNDIRKYFV